MSRIGKWPVKIDKGVSIVLDTGILKVKGSKGELEFNVAPTRYKNIKLEITNESLTVMRVDDSRFARMEQGLVRALVQNMVLGVTAGFKKELDIVGVGYRAETKGKTLILNVGYSNPVNFIIPTHLEISVDKNNRITVEGIDKQQVGEIAAQIRRIRPPEPYKGKGIRYVDEVVRRKVGKAAGG